MGGTMGRSSGGGAAGHCGIFLTVGVNPAGLQWVQGQRINTADELPFSNHELE